MNYSWIALGLLSLLVLAGCHDPESTSDTSSQNGGRYRPRVVLVGLQYQLVPEIGTSNEQASLLAEFPVDEPVPAPTEAIRLFFDRLKDRLVVRLKTGLPQVQFLDHDDLFRILDYQVLPDINTSYRLVPTHFKGIDLAKTPELGATLTQFTSSQFALSIVYEWQLITSMPGYTPFYRLSARFTVVDESGKIAFSGVFPIALTWQDIQKNTASSQRVVRETTSGTLQEGPYLFHSLNRKRYEQVTEQALPTMISTITRQLKL